MYKIEVIGMRKKKNKIIVVIALLLLIGILAVMGIYFKHQAYNKTIEVSITEINETKELNSGTITSEEQNNTQNITNGEAQIEDEQKDLNKDNSNNNDETKESNIENETTQNFDTNKFIQQIENVYNGTEGKRVFLTFDDGPSEEVTLKILDILNKYNIKATFFVLGNRVKANPEIVKRAYEEGHYIANHGYSHKYGKIYKSEQEVLNEYNKTEELIRKAIGNPNYSSYLFRFPGGSKGGQYEDIKKKARKKLKESGIAYMDWSALTCDAEGAKSKEEILKNLKTTMNGWNNVVILMHDAGDKKITYETLEDVIIYLKEKGYKFENIYDLMKEK